MQSIHQFVAGFSKGDAITNEALVIREIFRSWGYRSDIFSETKRILPELRKHARDISEYVPESESDIVLLHLSIGSPINDIFAKLSCQKALLYHNITPAHYFDAFEKRTACLLAKGRTQANKLANAASVNMACSKYNATELTEMGFKDAKVLPLLLDTANFSVPPDRKTIKRFDNTKTNILFVGRCAPNKKLEDILRAFKYFQTIEPESRFIHAGSFVGTERYYYMLLALAKEFGINNVHFMDSVSLPQLNAVYKCADIFLCMSEHEGFCIPVIESMYHNVPVMAYAAAAVPETMDGAGILFHEKKFDMIAEMMGRLIKDTAFKNAVLKKQQERINRFKQLDLETKLRQYLSPLLEA
ncbi:glycosyltransferase family 4 protein [Verrucomicrobiota bacterium]